MQTTLRTLLVAGGMVVAAQAAAQITFYEHDNFRGRALATSRPIVNFDPIGYNDRASSVIVERGRWEICEHAHFEGRCMVLRPGNYPSLAAMGLNDRISSVRPAYREVHYENEVPPPAAPVPLYEYRQRPDERLFIANVTSVRAVVGPPEQRCWVERQQVSAPAPNVPGAIIGGIIGGVLGHQVGGGRGRDVATVGGAVAGVAIGANAGGGGNTYTQDVQKCASVPSSAAPQYWDVTYEFGGVEHRAQMSAPPGPTITVNRDGEPRG